MRRIRPICAAVCLWAALSQPTAAMTLREYQSLARHAQSEETARHALFFFLEGLRDGFTAANLVLHLRDQERLFCAPQNLALPPEALQSMIDGHLAGRENADFPGSWGVELALLGALESAFACD